MFSGKSVKQIVIGISGGANISRHPQPSLSEPQSTKLSAAAGKNSSGRRVRGALYGTSWAVAARRRSMARTAAFSARLMAANAFTFRSR